MLSLLNFSFSLILLFLDPIILVGGKTDEWYHQCEGEECGYVDNKATKDCHDSHEKCRDFSMGGECLKNPTWMHEHCRKACGICVVETTDEPCQDLHTSCPRWAEELECFTNPAYMSRACPSSCWLCVNPKELREKDVPEEQIQRRLKFSQTNFGLWQAIPPESSGSLALQVKEEIAKMGKYVRELNHTGAGTLCNNLNHDCARWVIEKGCHEYLQFMLPQCSLACQYCDMIESYHVCRGTSDSTDKIPFGNLNDIIMRLFHEKEAQNILVDSLEDRREGEYVLSMEKSALWKKPEEETEKLLDLLRSDPMALEWSPASGENYTDPLVHVAPSRSGRTAMCGTNCRQREPMLSELLSSIADLLKVDPSYIQPLEFVYYTRSERFAKHHEFRLHDQWKHGGNRVLTLFVALNNPVEGGGFGFPELDWLLIEKPQVLVWPNVSAKRPNVALERMQSEQLPVVEGDIYGVYAHVRQYPFDDQNPCS